MSYLVTSGRSHHVLSPCLLPMLPIYLSYFAAGTQGPGSTRATAKNALGFILGFTVTFLLLGTLAGSVGMLCTAGSSRSTSSAALWWCCLG